MTLTLGSALFDVPFAADMRHPDVSYVDPPAHGSDLPRSHATLSNDGHRELATLFAAAPDLLVAAEALMDIHSLGVLAFEDKVIADATDRLIHAIARARGKENT